MCEYVRTFDVIMPVFGKLLKIFVAWFPECCVTSYLGVFSFFCYLEGSGSSTGQVWRTTLSHSRNSFHRRELCWRVLLSKVLRRFSGTRKGYVRFSISLPLSLHCRQRRFRRQYFGRTFFERIWENHRISVSTIVGPVHVSTANC